MLDMAESLGHSKLLRSIGHNKTKTFQEHMLAQCWTSIANAGPALQMLAQYCTRIVLPSAVRRWLVLRLACMLCEIND